MSGGEEPSASEAPRLGRGSRNLSGGEEPSASEASQLGRGSRNLSGREEPSGPVCVLVGVMGAGKTTIGQLIAERLGVPFRDTDEVIVAAAGKPVSDIFVDDGEDAFRALERAAVADALGGFEGVLALGGGAVLADETRDRLKGHTVVFLSVELADVMSRVGLGVGRPLLALNPRATMRHLLEERRPLYEQVATLTVKTDGRDPVEVAAEILTALHPSN